MKVQVLKWRCSLASSASRIQVLHSSQRHNMANTKLLVLK